jgi:hypothetical protein
MKVKNKNKLNLLFIEVVITLGLKICALTPNPNMAITSLWG